MVRHCLEPAALIGSSVGPFTGLGSLSVVLPLAMGTFAPTTQGMSRGSEDRATRMLCAVHSRYS